MKVNGKLCYLWRAVDHEGEVLEAVITARRDKAAAHKLLKRIMKKYGAPCSIVTDRLRAYSAAMKRNWPRRSARGRWPPQQSGGEFSSTVSTTGAGDAAVSKYEDVAEIQLNSRPGPESFQSGAASHHMAGLQAETHGRIGGVARPCRVERRLRAGVSPCASANPVTLTTPPAASFSIAPRAAATFSGRRPAGAGGARQRGRAHAGIGPDRGQQPPLGGLRFGRLDEAPGLVRPRPRRERRRRMRSTSGRASSLMRPPYRHLRWPCAQVQAHHGAALIPAQRLGSSTSAIAARASIAIVVAVGAVRRVWVTVGAAAVTR